MTSRMRLDIPTKFPRWATDAGMTVEPNESGSLGSKDLGYVYNTRVPPKWLNWLLNTSYEFSIKSISAAVGTYAEVVVPHANNWGTTFYDHVNRVFVCPEAAPNGDVSVSINNGSSWVTNATAITFVTGFGTFNSSHMMAANSGGNIEYSSDIGATWATEAVAGVTVTMGDTDYPNSDLIVAGGTAAIKFSTAGIGGSWTSPTTLTIGGTLVDVFHTDDDNWIVLNSAGNAHRSVNSAVDFAALANEPSGVDSGPFTSMDANVDAGTTTDGVLTAATTLAVCGDSSGGDGQILYTHDLGTSAWQQSTITTGNPAAVDLGAFKKIRYIGGGMWIAIGTGDSNNDSNVFLSVDNAENFHLVSVRGGGAIVTFDEIAVSPSKIILAQIGGAAANAIVASGTIIET